MNDAGKAAGHVRSVPLDSVTVSDGEGPGKRAYPPFCTLSSA